MRPPLSRVAHAGGAFKKLAVTNSLDALNANKKLFDFFEIDFNFTKDNRLVCIHDWEGSFEYTFGFVAKEVPSYDQFLRLVERNPKFKNCTLESLISWLKKNPTKRIVTDVKDHNLAALEMISKEYPQFLSQFIPQIYAPDEYYPVHQMGYRDIIFTLYRFGTKKKMILTVIKKYEFYAITMPEDTSYTLTKNLNRFNIPTFVHTINSPLLASKLFSQGVAEIYTDQLFGMAPSFNVTPG